MPTASISNTSDDMVVVLICLPVKCRRLNVSLPSCRRSRSRCRHRVLLPFPTLDSRPRGIYVSDVEIGILRYRDSTWQYTF